MQFVQMGWLELSRWLWNRMKKLTMNMKRCRDGVLRLRDGQRNYYYNILNDAEGIVVAMDYFSLKLFRYMMWLGKYLIWKAYVKIL